MKIVKAIWTIILLVLILTIPKVLNWVLQGLIRVLIVIQKTLSFLIKLVLEEINKEQYEKTPNSKN